MRGLLRVALLFPASGMTQLTYRMIIRRTSWSVSEKEASATKIALGFKRSFFVVCLARDMPIPSGTGTRPTTNDQRATAKWQRASGNG